MTKLAKDDIIKIIVFLKGSKLLKFKGRKLIVISLLTVICLCFNVGFSQVNAMDNEENSSEETEQTEALDISYYEEKYGFDVTKLMLLAEDVVLAYEYSVGDADIYYETIVMIGTLRYNTQSTAPLFSTLMTEANFLDI